MKTKLNLILALVLSGVTMSSCLKRLTYADRVERAAYNRSSYTFRSYSTDPSLTPKAENPGWRSFSPRDMPGYDYAPAFQRDVPAPKSVDKP